MVLRFSKTELAERRGYDLIKEAVARKDAICTFLRVDHDVPEGDYRFSAWYMGHLTRILDALPPNGVNVGSFSYVQKLATTLDDPYPRVFVVSGNANPEKSSRLRTLIDMVEECPEGVVLESIKDEFLRQNGGSDPFSGDWGNAFAFPDFLKRVKAANKKVLKIGYGPVSYPTNNADSVAELFLGPTLVGRD